MLLTTLKEFVSETPVVVVVVVVVVVLMVVVVCQSGQKTVDTLLELPLPARDDESLVVVLVYNSASIFVATLKGAEMHTIFALIHRAEGLAQVGR